MPLSGGPMVAGITSPLTIVSSAASEHSNTDPGRYDHAQTTVYL